ncbi:MAG: TraR/DksA C4-type zinc finger protein [Halofilum sp. (in: g-proteobacteria)]|nr:TraR/DksA C4-type zinc finger protein [Halofilum sp. (in: g-proteobacteria)]
MDDGEIDEEHFRARLLELCEELQASRAAGDEAAATVELDQQRQGRLARMDALGAQAMSAAAQRRRDEMLKRARRALARIEAGDYGYCAICDEPIDPRRLAFDPTVELCIRCAERAERD